MSIKDDMKEAKAGNMESVIIKNKLERLFYEDRKEEERYGLHASAIIGCEKDGFCYREQLLSLFFKMNQGEQLPVKLLKIFAQGNAMHEKWYKLFRNAGIAVAIERTLFLPEFDLSFTIDALLDFNLPFEDREPDEYICDVKSMNTHQFKHVNNHPSGEEQVNFYMWALTTYEKNRSGKKYKKGFVLIDDKNDQEIKVPVVHYNKSKIEPKIACLREIQTMKKEFIENRIVPPRICKNCDCKRASVCGMRDACWNIGMGRIPLPKSLREKRLEDA